MRTWLSLVIINSIVALACIVYLCPIEQLVQMIIKSGYSSHSVSILLLVPLSVCAVVAMRVLLGLEGFGIFAPLILGLSFSKVGLVPGLLGFSLIVLILVPVRLLLERISILTVTRTGLLVSGCSLCILYMWYLGKNISIKPDIGLPIVVMAGIVDRFVTAQMDQSPGEATKQSIHTLIIASVCALIAGSDAILSSLLLYPDASLISLPILALLGRYKGLRLIEVWRFRSIK